MKMTAVAPLQRAYPRAILASLLFLFALPALIWWLGVRLLEPGQATVLAEPGSPIWQLQMAVRLARALLMAGAGGLGVLALLAWLVTQGRAWRAFSLRAALVLLPLMGVAGVVAQAMLLAWMCQWLVAKGLGVSSGKLLAAGLGAGALMLWPMLKALLTLRTPTPELQGQSLKPADAPELWDRIRRLSALLQTKAPDHLVASVEAQFFVTQSPVKVQGQRLTGRVLAFSLPLLRRLEKEEADAVLVHELAHFLQDDTAYAASIGFSRRRFEACHARMARPGGSLVVCHLMTVYRMAFEWAESRASRRRELAADRLAMRHVSPYALVNALVKIVAYGRYRQLVEEGRFAQQSRHQEKLCMGERIAAGLDAYVGSEAFGRALQEAPLPHPFDAHPTLQQRMQAAKLELSEETCRRVLRRPVIESWVDAIHDAEGLESRLWARHEAEWAAAGEQGRAARLDPRTQDERQFVERHFPARRFELKDGQQVQVQLDGLKGPGLAGWLAWRDIQDMDYRTGLWSDRLRLDHPPGHHLGPRSVLVLRGIRPQREAFLEALNQHWHRHAVLRRHEARTLPQPLAGR